MSTGLQGSARDFVGIATCDMFRVFLQTKRQFQIIFRSGQMTIRASRFAIIIASLGVSGMIGATPLAAEGFKRIATEAEFNQLVVGQKLGFNDDYFTIRKNGSLKGKFGGKTLKGNWAWRDGYWCRTLSTHSKNTDCQVWEASGEKFKVTRERGNGKSFTYVLK